MSDSEAVSSVPAASASPKNAAKKKTTNKTGAAKGNTKSTHPKTSDMVNAAIKNLKERGGSSLQAIKKYISANYKVDAEKIAPFIRKYLKSAVTSGSLIQTKGKGASGSFKLAPTAAKEKKKVVKETSPSKVTKAKKSTKLKMEDSEIKKASSVIKKKKRKPSVTTSTKIVNTPKKRAPKATANKVKIVGKTPIKKVKTTKPKKTGTPPKAKSPTKKAAPKKK